MAEGYGPCKKIKTEDDDMSKENHSHTFILKFSNSEETYTIHCDRPQTVLEAISKKMDVLQELKCEKQNLTVQIGEGRLDTAIATHFPCFCLKNGELVTLAAKNEEVEQQGTVSHSERYCILYIRTEGGLNSKTKSIFRSVSIKKFKELIVYGTKGMTIKDAITRDGRFIELGHFKLEDVSTAKSYVFSDDNIETHEKKTFKICLEKMTKATVNIKLEEQSTEQKSAEKGRAQDASDQTLPPRAENTEGSEEVRERKATKNGNVKEIYERLRQQFPHLKEIMQERYPGNTFEEVLKKVDFGKVHQSFSDVCRLKKLFKLGKSVGKLVVGNAMTGTAFVLCDHYIITNAHLFKGVVKDKTLDPNVEVSILFYYINDNLENNSEDISEDISENISENTSENISRFIIAHEMIDFDEEQDYAVLELQVSDEKVPPGLMKLFCPMPESGEACLFGHPAGDIQRIDPTCIIENTSRSEEVEQHLDRFKDNMIAHMSVCDALDRQGISRILSEREPLYNSVSTYHTFMYHGSSGSPVFDAHCRVFGLHSGGFVYGLPPLVESVIEFSHPLLLIFEKFVTSLKNRNQNKILRVVKEHSKRNVFLKEILGKILGSENVEPMGTD